MLVDQDVGQPVHRAAPDAVGSKPVQPRLGRLGGEVAVQNLPQLRRMLGLSDKQTHRCRIDSGPNPTGAFVGVGVNFGGATPSSFASFYHCVSRCEIFIGACQHPECFFVGLPFLLQLF